MMTKSFLITLSFVLFLTNQILSVKVDEYLAVLRDVSLNEQLRNDYQNWTAKLYSYPNYPYGKNPGAFPCPPLEKSSRNEPLTVHNLRPSDVQCVAAIGDSLTAGLGALAGTPIGLVTENRGVSWSVGGDGSYESYLTLPNILREYNPNLKGFSTGNSLVFGNNQNATHNALNVARTSAVAVDTYGQAQNLVGRMIEKEFCDLKNDWKVITYFIGGNDLCLACQDTSFYSPENYLANIKQTLDYLYENVPRALVNLVPVLDIRFVEELNKGGSFCQLMHSRTCPCGGFPNTTDRETISKFLPSYHDGPVNLINSGIYDTRDDFTVVIQPFLIRTPLPLNGNKPDFSYFSTDCFHFSAKGHSRCALALWNNMLEPVGKKQYEWHQGEQIECPDPARPYFATRKNSPQAFEKIPPLNEKK